MEYIIAFLISIIGVYNCQKKAKKMGWYILAIIPIILLAALRDHTIGEDTDLYVLSTFERASFSKRLISFVKLSNIESGYLILNYIVSRFTDKFWVYLFVQHSIMYGAVIYALYKLRSQLSVWVGVFILCFVFYRESLNTTRQCLALFIDVIAFAYLIRSKYLITMGLALFSYGFHHSNLIFFFIIFLHYSIEKWPHIFRRGFTKFMMIVGIIIVLSFFTIILSFVGDFYEEVQDKYMERYGSSERYGTNIPISLFALNIVNLLIFYATKTRMLKRFRESLLIVFFEYILISSFMMCFAGLISTYAVRVGNYFSYMTILIFPILFYKYGTPKLAKNLHLIFLLFYWFMVVVVTNLGRTYPYLITKEFTF